MLTPQQEAKEKLETLRAGLKQFLQVLCVKVEDASIPLQMIQIERELSDAQQIAVTMKHAMDELDEAAQAQKEHPWGQRLEVVP